MSYQKFIAVGNLVRDPSLKYTPQGTAVCNFTVAVNSKMKDKDEVLFMDCVTFGKQAEVVDKYLSKGLRCLVEGRLTERSWEKDGETKKKMELITNDVKFLSTKTEKESPVQSSSDKGDEGLEPF